jgi:hypothetical protein
MVQDYRALVTVIGNPDFIAEVVEYDQSEDKIWYLATVSSLQNLPLWQKEILKIELTKGQSKT